MDVNHGIQAFDSSIRCRDGDPRIAQYFCDASIAILTFVYPASAIFFDFVVNGRLISPVQFLGLAIILLTSVGITQGWELPRFPLPG